MTKSKRHLLGFIKYFNVKTLLVLFLDASIIALSFLFAILIKNDLIIDLKMFLSFLYELPVIIFVYWISFAFLQMYNSLWKYAGLEEVVKGVIANGIAISVSYIFVRFVYVNHLSASFYITAFFVISFTTLFSRMFYRVFIMLRTLIEIQLPQKKALIVGAGAAGNLVYTEVKRNADFDTKVVGFIDDDIGKKGKYVHSIPVVGTTLDIDSKIVELGISVVYVAIPQASKEKIKEVLNIIEKTGVQIKLFPPFYEVFQPAKMGQISLRDINIEDLLGRDPIVLEENGISDYIKGKTIIVTGGGGSIGSELCRQLRHFDPSKIIIVDIYENNVYDLQMEFERLYRLNNLRHKPEIIVLIASVRDEHRMDEVFE
ncbi:MAG: polysaccharide biosynthesis protein, partial [Firmicutes bacterium]|nr:polysaccharide biosynthesis protein [Bacillota bacterium]